MSINTRQALTAEDYLKAYNQDSGFNKFHGAVQSGRGIGSFLSGIARAALPVILKGGAKVITGLVQGQGLKQSLKSGLGTVVQEGLEKMTKTTQKPKAAKTIKGRVPRKKASTNPRGRAENTLPQGF